MQRFTASRAKQSFGALLEAVAHGPVAVVRHDKVKAIVASPEAFEARASAVEPLALRRAALAAQAIVDRDRLIKHQKIAIELLLMPAARRRQAIARAHGEVARWRRYRLCSADYCDRWDEWLARPVVDLARAMSDTDDPWGQALRQNSPWHVVVP